MLISLDNYKNQLLDAGIKNAKNEIHWFLEKKFDFLKENIIFKKISLDDKQIEILTDFIDRRIQKEPFQYILNCAPFCDIDIYINNHVLIPRPETETIINLLIKQNKRFSSALDLCCGSGNLAIMLSLKKIAKNITAIDISNNALKVSKKNFKNFKLQNVDSFQLDFMNQKINKKFDLIVCNPPYISNEEYSLLTSHVKDFEPREALTDGKDGLSFYKKIHQEIDNIVNPNGTILLEIGLEKHKSLIESLFNNHKYKWHKDLNNNYRIIQIFK